jgi:hypothetical protein
MTLICMLKVGFFILLLIISLFINAQNKAFIQQNNGLTNSEINLVQIGGNNLLSGFIAGGILVEDALGNLHHAAYQYSQSGGSNKLNVEQLNPTIHNEIILYQEAYGNNESFFKQADGSHTLQLKEISLTGSNAAHITQLNGSGYINLEQKAFLSNTIPSATGTIMNNPNGYTGIYQEGENNFIYGATAGYDPDLGNIAIAEFGLPAMQLSEAGSNWLEIWQTGGNNIVGLYQEGIYDNTAFIYQYNGFNTAEIYQKGSGANYAQIVQAGGMIANVYQNGGGSNRAIIEQY